MRIKLTFTFNSLILPIHYNYVLQGTIYRNLKPSTATRLHEQGYRFGERVFRHFTFSNLKGAFQIQGDEIRFWDRAELWISSIDSQVLSELAHSALNDTWQLMGQSVTISAVEVIPTPKIKPPVQIQMLSPMTIYSTLQFPDGRKKTYYYAPTESEFSELIERNAKKKYQAYYPDADVVALQLSIRPLRAQIKDQKILKYKGTVIKGWMGRYELDGNADLIGFTWDVGLGGKNAQGFGLWSTVL